MSKKIFVRNIPTEPEAAAPAHFSDLPEFDVEKLLSLGGEILHREIRHLMRESADKKLSPASARDLVAYVKLLSEVKSEQQEALKDLTDEELLEIAKNSNKRG